MTDVKTTAISPELIKSAYTYKQYREFTDELLSKNKTTGENHSEAMIHYTKMNQHRMNRLDKRTELKPELVEKLSNFNRRVIWLVLTEAWCGDAAQILPVLQKMAEVTSNIELKFILRDENLEIMDEFLTNGRNRSIPKLICVDAETCEVLGEWGPRPELAQDLYLSLRNQSGLLYQEVAERLHKWYADDKTEAVQNEFVQLLDRWGSS